MNYIEWYWESMDREMAAVNSECGRPLEEAEFR